MKSSRMHVITFVPYAIRTLCNTFNDKETYRQKREELLKCMDFWEADLPLTLDLCDYEVILESIRENAPRTLKAYWNIISPKYHERWKELGKPKNVKTWIKREKPIGVRT